MLQNKVLAEKTRKIFLVAGFISFIISLIVIFRVGDVLIARILFVLAPFLVLFGDQK